MPVSKKPRKGKSLVYKQVIKKTKIVKVGLRDFTTVQTNEVDRTILHRRNPVK